MEGYKRTIGWMAMPENEKILQIYSKGLEYALVSSNYQQCHPFVWCKDFLHDVVHAAINDRWFEIYKFRYNPLIDPAPCLDRIRLLIANPKDRKFASKIPNVLDFLNQIETQMKIKKSFARECANPPVGHERSGVFMFEGSRRWISSPPMLSMYSLMIRIGFVHKIGTPFMQTLEDVKSGKTKPYQQRDKMWLKSVDMGIKKIMRVGDRKIFHKEIELNYPEDMKIETIHNRLGIMSYASDILTKALGHPVPVPYWHYHK